MNQYMTAQTRIKPYIMFPRFLLDADLPETAKLLYIVLLDRARTSARNDGWQDPDGKVYVYYTIKELAETLHKSEMTIKSCLNALEKADLIFRRRQGVGLPNRIYVKIPVDNILSMKQTESCLSGGQEAVHQGYRNLSGNKNNKSKNYSVIKESNIYGTYRNVFLSDEELADLQATVPDYEDYIERLSRYMKSKGKRYENHAATIKSWYARDRPFSQLRNYDCKEDESL